MHRTVKRCSATFLRLEIALPLCVSVGNFGFHHSRGLRSCNHQLFGVWRWEFDSLIFGVLNGVCFVVCLLTEWKKVSSLSLRNECSVRSFHFNFHFYFCLRLHLLLILSILTYKTFPITDSFPSQNNTKILTRHADSQHVSVSEPSMPLPRPP
jgi:hypothetical protein